MPKERRAPQMPEATPTHVVEALLTLAVIEPTIGCRQYADRLGDQGFSIAKSTVQKHLVAHGLGKRAQRLARAAAITAATTGLVTEAAREGRALRVLPGQRWSGRARLPRQLLHRQAQGRGQGVPAHRHRRLHPLGLRRHRARPAQRRDDGPLHRPGCCAPIGATGCRVRADPQRQRSRVRRQRLLGALAAKGLAHQARSRPARPTTTPWCERFHGTILQECWRPAFHRRHFTSIRQLQAEADAWLITYHHRRRNHGDYMRGRTPHQVLDNHKRNKAA